jgi:hypothetical protein
VQPDDESLASSCLFCPSYQSRGGRGEGIVVMCGARDPDTLGVCVQSGPSNE